MCLTIPGKIIELSDNIYKIEYGSERLTLNISLIDDLKIGDYVIVSNRIIVARVSKEDAKRFFDLIGRVHNDK